MTLVELLVLLIIAALIGGLGQSLSGFTSGGCLASIALGFVGAVLGSWIARAADLPAFFVIDFGGVSFPIIWSIIGAALFVALLRMISGRRAPI